MCMFHDLLSSSFDSSTVKLKQYYQTLIVLGVVINVVAAVSWIVLIVYITSNGKYCHYMSHVYLLILIICMCFLFLVYL